jgi:hypothetical protein
MEKKENGQVASGTQKLQALHIVLQEAVSCCCLLFNDILFLPLFFLLKMVSRVEFFFFLACTSTYTVNSLRGFREINLSLGLWSASLSLNAVESSLFTCRKQWQNARHCASLGQRIYSKMVLGFRRRGCHHT